MAFGNRARCNSTTGVSATPLDHGIGGRLPGTAPGSPSSAQRLEQPKDRQLGACVGPNPTDSPPAFANQRLKARDLEFSRTLRVNGFTGVKVKATPRHHGGLRAETHQVHLDRCLCLVPPGDVSEPLRTEVPAELAIDSGENCQRTEGGKKLR